MQAARGIYRSSKRVAVGLRVRAVLLIALLALVTLAGCGGSERSQDTPDEEQGSQGQTVQQSVNPEARVEGAGDAGNDQEEVTLRVEGTPETEFSGTCTVGDEEEKLSGQIPEGFVYELGDQKLECEIRKQSNDASSLKVVLTAPGNNIVQQTNTPGGSVNLTYSGSGISSTSSSTSSVNQIVSSSSVGSW